MLLEALHQELLEKGEEGGQSLASVNNFAVQIGVKRLILWGKWLPPWF